MAYEKLGFTSGQVLKADHLNHIEEGIANASGETCTVSDEQIDKIVDAVVEAIEQNGGGGISASVTYDALECIEVSDECESYSAVDGILYNKSGDTLIAYPMKKKDEEFTVPQTVTAIADFAFCDCKNLKKIYLHEGMTSIRDNCFTNTNSALEKIITLDAEILNAGGQYPRNTACYNANTVVIPEDTAYISSDALWQHSTKTKLYFNALSYEIETYEEESKSGGYDYYSPFSTYHGQSIKEAIIGDGVTTIVDKMFAGCGYLERITIPPSVTSIGTNIFHSNYDTINPVICGYSGSYAETWAIENGYTFEAITE